VVVVTGHRNVDYERVVNQAARVVDSCNAVADADGNPDKVLRLGAPAGT
jgi:hypothetical protein